jgi:tetratricopeptide (TPR) repeat protein
MVVEECRQERLAGTCVSSEWLRAIAHGLPAEQWLPGAFLGRLSEIEREVVVCAAVPQNLNLELIRHLLRKSGFDPPVDWWDRLCRHSFVRRVYDHSTGHHQYMHRMVRAAILTHLHRQEPARLSTLHLEAADYFMQLPRLCEEIYHRFAGRDYGLLSTWRAALHQARRRHDIDTATRLLDAVIAPEQVIRVSQDNPALVVEAEHQQGLVEYTQDRYDAAIRWLTSALRGFQRIGNDDGESRSHRWLAVLRCYMGEYMAAEECGRHALVSARRARDPQLLLDGHSVMGMIYQTCGQWRRALGHYAAVMRLARQADNAAEECESFLRISEVLLAMGRNAESFEYLDLAEVVAQTVSGEKVAMCYYSRGWHEIYLGNSERALESLERSIHLTRQEGNFRDIGWALRPIATAHIVLGQQERARPLIAEALEIFDELEDRSGQALMHGLNALADLSVSQHEAAKVAANTAWLLCRASPTKRVTGWIELISSAIDALTGEGDLDVRLRSALALYDRSSDGSLVAGELIMIADVLSCAGDQKIARSYLKYAMEYVQHVDNSLDIQRRIGERLAEMST